MDVLWPHPLPSVRGPEEVPRPTAPPWADSAVHVEADVDTLVQREDEAERDPDSRCKKEIPNYKPLPLRWPFLASLLLCICGLVGFLEQARHTLPVIDARRALATPQLLSLPTDTAVAAAAASSTNSTPLPSSTSSTLPAAARVATTSSRTIRARNLGGYVATTSSPLPLVARVQDPANYANPKYTKVYLSLQSLLTLGPDMQPSGVPYGVDVSTRCLQCVKNIAVVPSSDDPRACPASQDESGTVAHDGICLSGLANDWAALSQMDECWRLWPHNPLPRCWQDEIDAGTILSYNKSNGPQTTRGEVTTITLAPGVVTTVTRRPGEELPRVRITRTDSLGRPTATVTSFPFGVTRPMTTVTRIDLWMAISTVYQSELPVSTILRTLTNSEGKPIETLAEYPIADPTWRAATPAFPTEITLEARPLYGGDHFVGTFVPVLLSTLLAIPVQILNSNLKAMLPFHALTRAKGATASESLTLATGGIWSLVTSSRHLYGSGEPLWLLGDFLVLLSAVLIPLSSEAVSITLYGNCLLASFQGCAMSLATISGPSIATAVLLIIMAILVMCLGIFLVRWRSGVAASPWSIAAIASLMTSVEIRELLRLIASPTEGEPVPKEEVERKLSGRLLALGHHRGPDGCEEYGVMVKQNRSQHPPRVEGQRTHAKFLRVKETLIWLGGLLTREPVTRAMFLVSVIGLMVLILYYENTQHETAFERWMDNQGFGVTFFFTSTGVAMGFYWEHFFSQITTMEPYRRLAQRPQSPEAAILIPRSTTVFTGLWCALRHGDIFPAAVAFAGVLSKFTPIFLSNIPYRQTLTWATHQVCAWTSAGILGIMVVVLAGSFMVKQPYLPVWPGTIAGCMYYVCDSKMLRDMEGMSTLNGNWQGRQLGKLGRKYQFGRITGVSGESRIGIDYVANRDEISWKA